MQFNIDSWPWKIAVVVALLGMREFVRLLSPKEASGERGETSKWLIETIDSAAIAIGLVLFIIQPFILQAFFIPSGSMEDTLRVNDRLLVSKLVYKLKDPAFQDVVVFKAPPAANNPPETDFIKRLMGTPGDTVYMVDRQIFRNGKKVPEIYTKWSDPASSLSSSSIPDVGTVGNGEPRYSYDMKIVGQAVYSREYLGPNEPGGWSRNGIIVAEGDQAAITNAKPGKVPPGYYLFLGDHRNNSNDGHVWGFAPRANVVGKAICVFWPPTRLGLVDRMSSHPRKP
ncbi:signal peptidase I [Abditibacterium utsteinense]|nr:signal peptidase I [Abditibacterium utsteinense]